MKVLIIEDEAPAFRRLEKILREIDPSIEILEVFDSIEDTVGCFRSHDAPDLVFMDIQISDGIMFSANEGFLHYLPAREGRASVERR